ncbi:MAG: hypothetical protein ACYTGR_07570 [Planctomycetota bacterium]|jgi:hypothetical protein
MRSKTNPGSQAVPPAEPRAACEKSKSLRCGELFGGNRDVDSAAVIDELLVALAGFCGSDRYEHDDVTVIALDFEPITKGECLRRVLLNRCVRPALRGLGAIRDRVIPIS